MACELITRFHYKVGDVIRHNYEDLFFIGIIIKLDCDDNFEVFVLSGNGPYSLCGLITTWYNSFRISHTLV